MEEIINQVNRIFQIIFEKEDLVVTEDTCADDIPEWDSLQHINLLAMLEKEFGIKFSVDDIIEMENVGDIIRIIQKERSSDL